MRLSFIEIVALTSLLLVLSLFYFFVWRSLPSVPDVMKETMSVYAGVMRYAKPTEANPERIPQGGGAAMLLSRDGLVLSAAHVLMQGNLIITDPDRLMKSFDYIATLHSGNGAKEYDARVLNIEAPDIGILKVSLSEDESRSVRTVRFGDSDRLIPGDPVCARGQPLRWPSVTCGVVRSVGNKLEFDVAGVYGMKGDPLIEVDAGINPGNSGGPLYYVGPPRKGLNPGDVVAMINIFNSRLQVDGFGIPSNTIRKVLKRTICKERPKLAVCR